MWRVLVVCAVAACGRTGFASLPCTDAPTDTTGDATMMPPSHSTLSLDRVDPMITITDFPLLVTLDDSRAARDLLDAGGSNIRFVDSGGNVVPHEIEQLGTPGIAGAPLIAWVRVPSISGLSTTLEVEIGGTLPEPSQLSVWPSRYEAVYHLADTHDSTSNRHDGTTQGSVTRIGYPGCAIGTCQSFDGVSSAVTIPDAPTLDLPNLTISVWMYQRSSSAGVMAAVSRRASGTDQDFFVGTNSNFDYANVSVVGAVNNPISGPGITLGHWTHIAITYGGSLFLFVDGVSVAMTSIGQNIQHDAESVVIGAVVGQPGFLDGMVDEVRLEHGIHPAAWMSYEDTAMRDGVISYGPIER